MKRQLFQSKWTPKYLLALSIMAFLLLTINMIIQYVIATEKNSSLFINVSGKQRMLSKEIALRSIQLVNSDSLSTREKLRVDILVAVQEMGKAHNQLIASDVPSVHSIYFESSKSLDSQVYKFVEESRTVAQLPDSQLSIDNPQVSYIIDKSSNEFIASLDNVVNQFQLESEKKLYRLQQIETYSLLIALLVLLFEALYIFRPMVKTIDREKLELIEMNKELERLCLLDGLTGVANRRHFDKYIQDEMDRGIREKTPLSLIMIDIDYFKAYNDTYGHLVGDDCLKQVASNLAKIVKRPTDLIARYGGEEFAAVLPNTDLAGAISVAKKLRSGIEQLEIPHSKSSISSFVTVSLGVSVDGLPKYNGISTLIATADDALYKAKHLGRNNVQFSASDTVLKK